MRNGDRWRVAAIDPTTGRIAAERLTDNARAVFDADYVVDHVTHGYATTVHAAQGVTADATHAVLGENATRSMLSVAMTRGRDANTAYLYERSTEQEYGPAKADGPHVLQRGTSRHAGLIARVIIANHDDVPATAHQVAAATPRQLLPDMMGRLLARREEGVERLQTANAEWQRAVDGWGAAMAHRREQARAASRGRGHSRDSGIEY